MEMEQFEKTNKNTLTEKPKLGKDFNKLFYNNYFFILIINFSEKLSEN